jgi:hypothetical protein
MIPGCQLQELERRGEVTYLPVGLAEGGTLVEDVVGTSRVTSLGSTWFSLTGVTGRVPNGIGSGPITTESVGKDVEVFGEELVRVTSVSSEVGSGLAPWSGVGVLVGDIGRNVVSAKEPNSDTGLSPFNCMVSHVLVGVFKKNLRA